MSICTEWTVDPADEQGRVDLLRRRARGDANPAPDPAPDALRRPARGGAIRVACTVGPDEENVPVRP